MPLENLVAQRLATYGIRSLLSSHRQEDLTIDVLASATGTSASAYGGGSGVVVGMLLVLGVLLMLAVLVTLAVLVVGFSEGHTNLIPVHANITDKGILPLVRQRSELQIDFFPPSRVVLSTQLFNCKKPYLLYSRVTTHGHLPLFPLSLYLSLSLFLFLRCTNT